MPLLAHNDTVHLLPLAHSAARWICCIDCGIHSSSVPVDGANYLWWQLSVADVAILSRWLIMLINIAKGECERERERERLKQRETERGTIYIYDVHRWSCDRGCSVTAIAA